TPDVKGLPTKLSSPSLSWNIIVASVEGSRTATPRRSRAFVLEISARRRRFSSLFSAKIGQQPAICSNLVWVEEYFLHLQSQTGTSLAPLCRCEGRDGFVSLFIGSMSGYSSLR